MEQAIVILFSKNKNIEKIRRKYVPRYKTFKPHVTLVYNFEIKDQEKLNEHLKNSIKGTRPFKLSLKGLKKSAKQYYLYLMVDKGRDKVTRLYEKLNRGILSGFKNKFIPKYTPHITLGVFKTKKQIDHTIRELEKKKIEYKTNIKSIQLLSLNKNHSIVKTKRFNL